MAQRGARLFLAARDREAVARIAEDLRVRHRAEVTCGTFEAEAYARHAALIEEARAALGGLDGLVVAVGQLGEQERAEHDVDHARRLVAANYTGPLSLLTHAANHLEAQGSGFIVGLSSVAGDRGRASNYVYGSAKGALSLFLQGMRSRLHDAGVQVLTVKPGPTDTKWNLDLGEVVDEPVKSFGGPALERTFSIAVLTLAVHHVVAVLPALDHLGDDLRRVLQVGVDEYNGLAACIPHSRGDGGLVAEVTRQFDDADTLVAGAGLLQRR
jgi:short-subunit dehydrogenase